MTWNGKPLTQESFKEILKQLEKEDEKVQKMSMSPAVLLALPDAEFIHVWKYGDKYMAFNQPVGLKVFNMLKERCEKLGLTI